MQVLRTLDLLPASKNNILS